MGKIARIVVSVFVVAALVRSAGAATPFVRYEDSHKAMGTVFTIVAYGHDQIILSEIVREVWEEIDRLDAQLSNYQLQSELSAINRDAAQQAVMVEPRLFGLIQDSIQYSKDTDGAFDITVGPLLKAWGFFRGQGRVPSDAELAKIMREIGYQYVALDSPEREIRFERQGIELDLGAIAKGYALDRAVEILRAQRVASALISSGTSSIYALGAPPNERAWKVVIRDPFDAKKAADKILIRNFSLGVSGGYEKFFKLRGKIYSHIFDPKTGRPVENMLSTAVFASLGETSDALSTSFYVMGPERSRTYLNRHPDLLVIFYLPDKAAGKFKRVEMKSTSFSVPPDSLAEIESDRKVQ